MARYAFSKTCNIRGLHKELSDAFGAAYRSIEDAAWASKPLTISAGQVDHDGSLSGPAIQAIVDAHLVDQKRAVLRRTKSGTTTNATPVTTAVIQLPANSAAVCRATVVASSGTNVNWYTITAGAKRGAGNAALVGSPTTTPQGEDMASASATIVASGQGVGVQVTGINATTILWTGDLEVEVFTS